MYKLRPFLPMNVMKNVYYSLIQCFNTVLDKILVLQKRVMRLITFSDAFPVFKYLKRVTPEQFHNWYKLNHEIHRHSTRSNFCVNDRVIINNLFITSARTANYGLKYFKNFKYY